MGGRLRKGKGALLSLPPPSGARDTLRQRLYDGLRRGIRDGSLMAGTRLPSTRTLAADLKVSRSTVVHAYTQLREEGFIETRDRGVTRVCPPRPTATRAEILPAVASSAAVGGVSRRGARLAGFWPHFPPIAERPPRAFRTSVPALDVFPVDLWARLTAARARRSTPASLAYGDPQGLPALRQAIADYLASARGVRCAPERILVTSGSQQALDLAARVLLDPGDAVWMEDPGYFGAGAALAAGGARLVPVPVDEQGLDVAEGRRRAADARVAFVTPARQMPLGVALSAARRDALLAWAADSAAWILEDDYDSEFRFADAPVPALLGLDPRRVLLTGTFSKVMYPALRLGYLVVPDSLVASFAAARRFMDFCPPQLAQAVLADFMAAGHFERHVRRMRTIYAERRQLLVGLLQRQLAGLVEIDAPDAGMNLIAWLPPGVDDAAVSRELADAGVDSLPVSACALERRLRPGLILGYSGVREADLRRGIAPLRRVVSAAAAAVKPDGA